MASTARQMFGFRGVEYGRAGTGFVTAQKSFLFLVNTCSTPWAAAFCFPPCLPAPFPYRGSSARGTTMPSWESSHHGGLHLPLARYVADAALDRSTLPSGAASNSDRNAEEATAVQVFTALKTAGHLVVDASRHRVILTMGTTPALDSTGSCPRTI
jgi:hypothetical protein